MSTALTANLVGSFISVMSLSSNKEWIIDYGANDHITFDFSCLKSPTSCVSNSTSVKLLKGESVSVTHIGYLPLTHPYIFIKFFCSQAYI